VSHHAVFAIDQVGHTQESVDGGAFTDLMGYALEVSAGLDAGGNPEVFVLGANHDLYVSDNGGAFTGLGGVLRHISAGVNGRVYAIGSGGDSGILAIDGTTFTPLNHYALEISAGVDSAGNPVVYGIDSDHSLFVISNAGASTRLGDYAKHVRGSIGDRVYSIGRGDDVQTSVAGAPPMSLGGDALEISAGLGAAAGTPEVFALGITNRLSVLTNGGVETSLGGYAFSLSAPSFGPAFSGDLFYSVGADHKGVLYQAGAFTTLAGVDYIPAAYGTSISAVSWGGGHYTVYTLNMAGQVLQSNDGGAPVNLGGYSLEISAGLDASGNPEVFALGGNHDLYVSDNGGGLAGIGGVLRHISASVNGRVYAIGAGQDSGIISIDAGGFRPLGGYAQEISAGLDANNNPVVYSIDSDSSLKVNDGTGFTPVYSYAKHVSGSLNNRVYAIGQADNVLEINGTTATDRGSSALAISAGVDASGKAEVYAVGITNRLMVSDGNGFVDLGSYALALSAPAFGPAFSGDLVFLIDGAFMGSLHRGVFDPVLGFIQ
jgi:hypothetical protein